MGIRPLYPGYQRSTDRLCRGRESPHSQLHVDAAPDSLCVDPPIRVTGNVLSATVGPFSAGVEGRPAADL